MCPVHGASIHTRISVIQPFPYDLCNIQMSSGGFRGVGGGTNEPPFEADNSDFAEKVFKYD